MKTRMAATYPLTSATLMLASIHLPLIMRQTLKTGGRESSIGLEGITTVLTDGAPPPISASDQCPLWVKSGHVRRKTACPLYPRKRHQMRHRGMSALATSRHYCAMVAQRMMTLTRYEPRIC